MEGDMTVAIGTGASCHECQPLEEPCTYMVFILSTQLSAEPEAEVGVRVGVALKCAASLFRELRTTEGCGGSHVAHDLSISYSSSSWRTKSAHLEQRLAVP